MAKYWIAGAIKRKGALTAKAKRAGAYKGGKISKAWIAGKARGSGRTARQARLAQTLAKMRK